jgi:hypothetical protein
MNGEMIVALMSGLGTCVGALGGILTANKLINYRLNRLEKKVDLHNNAVERLFIAEGNIREIQHEIRDLKKGA